MNQKAAADQVVKTQVARTREIIEHAEEGARWTETIVDFGNAAAASRRRWARACLVLIVGQVLSAGSTLAAGYCLGGLWAVRFGVLLVMISILERVARAEVHLADITVERARGLLAGSARAMDWRLRSPTPEGKERAS